MATLSGSRVLTITPSWAGPSARARPDQIMHRPENPMQAMRMRNNVIAGFRTHQKHEYALMPHPQKDAEENTRQKKSRQRRDSGISENGI
jgi:hypothetical protein